MSAVLCLVTLAVAFVLARCIDRARTKELAKLDQHLRLIDEWAVADQRYFDCMRAAIRARVAGDVTLMLQLEEDALVLWRAALAAEAKAKQWRVKT